MKVDAGLCSGQSRCWIFAPDLYALEDEGFNAARGGSVDVPPGKEQSAILGRKACPERAISEAD